MNKHILFALLLSLSIQFTFAQKKNIEYIPADATCVFSLHNNSIDKKLSWAKIINYQFIEEGARVFGDFISSEEGEIIREATLNPQKYGVALTANNYAFTKVVSEKNFSTTFILPLNNLEKFKTLVDAYLGEGSSTETKMNHGYNTLIKKKIALFWQKDHAIVSFLTLARLYGELDSAFEERTSDTFIHLIEQISNLNTSSSIAGQQAFVDWDKSIADMGIWINQQQMTAAYLKDLEKQLRKGGSTARYMQTVVPLFRQVHRYMNKDQYLGLDLSFDKGALKGYSRTYNNPEMIKYYTKIMSHKINKKILQYIDGKHVVAYMTYGYNPEDVYNGLKDYLITQSNKTTYNNSAGNLLKDLFGILEMFIDEKAVFNFLKGDALLAFNGVKNISVAKIDYVYNKEKNTYEEREKMVEEATPVFLMALSYGNEKNIMKFIHVLEQLEVVKSLQKNLFQINMSRRKPKIYIRLDKGILVISNDVDHLETQKQYAKLPSKHLKKIKNSTQIVFFDNNNFFNAIEKLDMLPNDKCREELTTAIRNNIEDIWIVNKKTNKGKFIMQEFSLNLKDKEMNLIQQLFNFLNKIYLKSLKGI